MADEVPLMNEKEKRYIAHCFSKNANMAREGIDYERIFNGGRVSCDFLAGDETKTHEEKFGKRMRRSRRWEREAVSTQAPFEDARLALSELWELLVILKWVELDSESTQELERTMKKQFEQQFSRICGDVDFFGFTSEYFAVGSEAAKGDLLTTLCLHSDKISNADSLYRFLLAAAAAGASLSVFYGTMDWSAPSTYVKCIFYLKNGSCVEEIKNYFMSATPTGSPYLPEFISLLTAQIDDEKAKEVIQSKARAVQ